jgi:hypothetical protein
MNSINTKLRGGDSRMGLVVNDKIKQCQSIELILFNLLET